jgi:hypothetical protein
MQYHILCQDKCIQRHPSGLGEIVLHAFSSTCCLCQLVLNVMQQKFSAIQGHLLIHCITAPRVCCCRRHVLSSLVFAAIGRLCEKCDGKCPICDSYVRPATLVRVCDECNYGSYEGRCVICGGIGVSDAYYCKECTLQEKDVSAVQAAGSDASQLCQDRGLQED